MTQTLDEPHMGNQSRTLPPWPGLPGGGTQMLGDVREAQRGQFQGGGGNTGLAADTAALTPSLPLADCAALDK